MVWFWYIQYKPSGCDFIKTVEFGYNSVYNQLNRINQHNRSKTETYIYYIWIHEKLFDI